MPIAMLMEHVMMNHEPISLILALYTDQSLSLAWAQFRSQISRENHGEHFAPEVGMKLEHFIYWVSGSLIPLHYWVSIG